MDYYYHEFEKLEEEFHDVISHYPLFKEMIDDIEKNDIKEINELLENDDEFYLKKAIRKIKDLIAYVKKTSLRIDEEYQKFDKLAKEWEKKKFDNLDDSSLKKINNQVKQANELIKSHDLNEIMEANKIMEKLLKW